jgi:hypothetical protein
METKRGSKALMATDPDVVGFVTREALLASQLPDKIADKHGLVHRPPDWS